MRLGLKLQNVRPFLCQSLSIYPSRAVMSVYQVVRYSSVHDCAGF